MFSKKLLISASFCFALLPLASSATVFTLYDETLNNLPENQAWLSYGSNDSAIKNVISGTGVNLQTNNTTSAGFSNYSILPPSLKNSAFPILDSSTGFTLSFSMQLNSESHGGSSSNRAGFSVILLDENNQGVELGFWENSIWSQSDTPLFQAKDEEVSFNTRAGLLTYDLTVFNGDYFLTQNDSVLLTGELKDYSAFTGGPFGSSIPYSLSNYLFLGDDTSSAEAIVTLGRISISDTPLYTVPAPLPMTLIGLGLLLYCPVRRKIV